MYDYIIGIDGGGTKTLGVLYDNTGKEIKRIQLGFSNFSVDEELSKANLRELISQLLSGIVKETKVFIQMGIAGASRLSDPQEFLTQIEKQFDCTASLDVDATISLYAIEKEEDETLIMAIGGTGSVIMVKNEGAVNRIGGWGHLLGDGGSAYHLVLETLKTLIDEYENDLPLSPVSQHLVNVIGAENPQKIVEFVYNKDKSTLAQLSVEIQSMADKDEKVKGLLLNEAKYLADQIILAHKRFVKTDKVVVALRGSFSLQALYVKEEVMRLVSKAIKDVRFDVDGPEPVYGAYVLAQNKIAQENK